MRRAQVAMLGGIVAALAVLGASSIASAAPRNVGFNVHQSLDTGVPVTAECKGSIARIDFNWFQAEPKEGTYDWALFDKLIDGARAKGLSVLAVIGYTPAWASSANVDGKESSNDVPRPGFYEKFVTAAVTRYRDRVDHWELWNEPNLGEFWEGTPQQYIDLVVIPGAKAVHAACPKCKTLGPDVATVGGKYDVWMKAVLEQAKDQLDIITGHVYADFPKIPGGASPSDTTFFTKLEAHRVLTLGDATIYEDPLSLRESMVTYGAGSKPFWLTETGKKAKFGDAAQMEAQAIYFRHVLEAMLSRPWWTTTIFYESFDEPGTTYDFGVALRDPAAPGGFRKKPACDVTIKAVTQQPLFGGSGSDCNDGLDNEGDGLADYPNDPDCESATTFSEGATPVDAGESEPSAEEAGVGDDASTSTAPSNEKKGCGCATVGTHVSTWSLPSVLVLFAIVARRRRRQ